jgi:KaiC/GvpD/RAD55 family RecA-like ATPase
MNRVKTGVKGLDKALGGGIPKGNLVLISGGAGVGKSTLCLQYLVEGARLGEKCLFITTEQSDNDLIRQGACFGWNLANLQKKGKLKICHLDITQKSGNYWRSIIKTVKAFKPKRIVVDSLTTLTDNLTINDLREKAEFSLVKSVNEVYPTALSEKMVVKHVMYALVNKLKKDANATTLVTTELYEKSVGLSADGASEFITDGVVLLKALSLGDSLNRTMEVRKMRYTDIDGSVQLFTLGKKGISFG